MRLLHWLKSRFEMAPLNRVAAVTCGQGRLEFRWPGGSTAQVGLADIERVLIRTTDRGPFDDDVFLVVEASDRRYVVPQGAAGAGKLLTALQGLPGFDNRAVIDSMNSSENKDFVCWRLEP